MINRSYPESDWQTFKQALNVWFDFSSNYLEPLPFRFSRSMLAPNLAGLIRDKKATVEDFVEDFKAFSRQLQCDVRTLLGGESVFEEFYGLTTEEDTDDEELCDRVANGHGGNGSNGGDKS